jgi:ABC-type dipeptide/oligopeptide/nickel transport system ATPase component
MMSLERFSEINWLQKTLLDFSRGTDEVLAITGDSGSGKSFPWGWTVEQLQRRLGKKIHETLSITIDT